MLAVDAKLLSNKANESQDEVQKIINEIKNSASCGRYSIEIKDFGNIKD